MADKYYDSAYYGTEVDKAIGQILNGNIPALVQEAKLARDESVSAKKQSVSAKDESVSAKNTSVAKATESRSWAVGGTGTRPGEDKNNAKYWAQQAAGSVAGVATFNGRSGIVMPQKGDYTAEQVGAISSSGGSAGQVPTKRPDGSIAWENPSGGVTSVNGFKGAVVLYTSGTKDIGEGAPLESGKLYLVYEP